MNKVVKTVLHVSLLIIGPTVALMLAHRWPTSGPPVGHWWPTGGPPVAQLAYHMPLLGQRWPTGQNDVGPPVAANGGPTAEPPVAQRWATGVVLSGSQCSDGSSSFTDPGLCSGFSEHCYDLVQVSYQSLDGLPPSLILA